MGTTYRSWSGLSISYGGGRSEAHLNDVGSTSTTDPFGSDSRGKRCPRTNVRYHLRRGFPENWKRRSVPSMI